MSPHGVDREVWCSHCNKTIRTHRIDCPYCFHDLSDIKEMMCHYCNQQVKTYQSFCPKCLLYFSYGRQTWNNRVDNLEYTDSEHLAKINAERVKRIATLESKIRNSNLTQKEIFHAINKLLEIDPDNRSVKILLENNKSLFLDYFRNDIINLTTEYNFCVILNFIKMIMHQLPNDKEFIRLCNEIKELKLNKYPIYVPVVAGNDEIAREKERIIEERNLRNER